MDGHNDQLVDAARIQANAQETVERFFHRGPFMLSLISILFLATIAGATWTTMIQWNVNRNSDDIRAFKNDKGVGIVEQTHNNTDKAERNSKQIRAINTKVFGYPDAGNE